MKEKAEIILDEKFFRGTKNIPNILKKLYEENEYTPKELVIKIQQSSDEWKKINGGPKHWIVSEETIFSLIQQILHLILKGCRISCEPIKK